MTEKKDTKKMKNEKVEPNGEASSVASIATKADLKSFLLSIRDKMSEEAAAPVYVFSAMNLVLNSPNIDELLDKANKEIARDIWLRLKQSGVQLRNPPMLFDVA